MSALEPASASRRRLVQLADQCVKCGLCLPHCPTYFLDASEAESPRGRIALARGLADGSLIVDPSIQEHLDHCLGCLSCQAVCPSDVRYGELIVETRALLGPSPRRPRALLAAFKHPRLLHVLRALGNAVGAPRWAAPLAHRLFAQDSPWRAAAETLPPPDPPLALSIPVSDVTKRGRVALFPGCIGSVYDAQALDAAEYLLRSADFQVTRLPAFCCGALDAHGGNLDAAQRQAVRVREALFAAGVDILLTATPGCLGTLRAAAPETRCVDALAFLAEHADALRFKPLAQRVALHIPCTQANVAGAADAVRKLLARIPGIDLAPLPLQPRCCGAAGSHMLEYPARAAELRRAKLDQAEALRPDRLVSGNIGCRLHLAAGWRERGHTDAVEHPLVLLARQLETT
jgi:glycolate oxidase iron-sulfur subunit